MSGLFHKKNIHAWTVAVSLLVAGSLFFLIYIYYLQAFGISPKRVAVGIFIYVFFSVFVYKVTQKTSEWFSLVQSHSIVKALFFWMFVSLLFAPHILPLPHYPASTLFQNTSEIEITFTFPDNNNDDVQLRGVWLSFDDKKYSSKDFVLAGNWRVHSGNYFINTNEQGKLTWKGKIGEKAKLTIFPMEKAADVIVRWDGEEMKSTLTENTIIFSKKNAASLSYLALISLAQMILGGYLLWAGFGTLSNMTSPSKRRVVIVVVLLSIGLTLVYFHFQSTDITDKLDLQISYHQSVMAGQSVNPWQYRLFSEWVLEGLVRLVASLGAKNSFYFAALILRIIQNAAIYLLSYHYYRKLGFKWEVALIGILFMSGSMLNSFFKSGFSFNTYFDVICYLVAGLMIIYRSYALLPLLTAVAALNRETSGLIPFLAGITVIFTKDQKSPIFSVLLSMISWAFVFFSLHLLYPGLPMFIPYESPPGISLLMYNINPIPYYLLIRFFGFVPFLSLLASRYSSEFLKKFFLVLVPAWFGIHLFASVISETRLFLVPQVVILIPLALAFITKIHQTTFNYEPGV